MSDKTADTGATTPEKTFTQEELDRIIGERLAKEKSKVDTTLAEREQQLAHRELMLTAKEKLTERGLPVELLEALNISDTGTLDKSLDTITNIIKSVQSPEPRFSSARVEMPAGTKSGIRISSGMSHGESLDADGGIRQAMGLKE